MKWWVDQGWLKGLEGQNEFQIRVKPHPEAWCRTPGDPFWRWIVPELPFPDEEWCKVRYAERRRLRQANVRQGHFPFPFPAYQTCRFPMEDNPYAMEWLLKGLPNATRELAREFGPDAWSLIIFLDLFGKPAVDLFRTNRFLAEVLFWKKGAELVPGVKPDWYRAFREDLYSPQQGLLPWIGLTADKRIVRLLKKMDSRMLVHWEEILEEIPHRLALNVTTHLPRIDFVIWEALRLHSQGQVTASFVLEVAENQDSSFGIWEEKMQVLRRLFHHLDSNPPSFRSTAHIDKVFDQLAQRLDRQTQPDNLPPLPEAPWAGNRTILPLRTKWDYIREAVEMRHCILQRYDEALTSECVHYRVLSPERATLELRRNPSGGGWKVSELRCSCNKIPQFSTHHEVTNQITDAGILHSPDPKSRTSQFA